MQEYWIGFPFPSPGYLPNPGIEPRSPALQVDFLPTEPQGKPYLPKPGVKPRTLSLTGESFTSEPPGKSCLRSVRPIEEDQFWGKGKGKSIP